LDEPLVYRLSCQGHCRVAMFGRDKHWKHLSAKPTPRLGIVSHLWEWDSWEMTRLIGSRWKSSNGLSRGVLIIEATFLSLAKRRKRRFFIYINSAGVLLNYDPPLSIPNREVKVIKPDDTLLGKVGYASGFFIYISCDIIMNNG